MSRKLAEKNELSLCTSLEARSHFAVFDLEKATELLYLYFPLCSSGCMLLPHLDVLHINKLMS